MRVVDPDHQWPLARQQRDEAPPRPLQLVLDVAVPRLHTERRCERVGELVGILRAEAREALAERVVDACHRVLRAGSRRGTQDLAERPECDAAPVRRISPEEGLRSRVGRGQALGELAREAGLADPGVAGDRHQLGHPVTGGPAVDELEQCHVVVAADEGNARPHPLGAGGLRAPDPQRLGEALGLNRFRFVDLGGPAGPRGALADQHLAGRRRLLQARRGVHGLAGDGQVVAAVQCEDLARLDPDPDGQSLVHGRDPLGQGERSRDRPVRVVGVDPRHPEHGEHRVADVLLDGPAVLLQGRASHLEERRETPAELLRVEVRGHLGRADQVGEDHRRELSLRAGKLPERRAARGAEPRVITRRSTAMSTGLSHVLTIPSALASRLTVARLHLGRAPGASEDRD